MISSQEVESCSSSEVGDIQCVLVPSEARLARTWMGAVWLDVVNIQC